MESNQCMDQMSLEQLPPKRAICNILVSLSHNSAIPSPNHSIVDNCVRWQASECSVLTGTQSSTKMMADLWHWKDRQILQKPIMMNRTSHHNGEVIFNHCNMKIKIVLCTVCSEQQVLRVKVLKDFVCRLFVFYSHHVILCFSPVY